MGISNHNLDYVLVKETLCVIFLGNEKSFLLFIYDSVWVKSPQVFLFHSSIRTWEKMTGIFHIPSNLPPFFSFLSALEWWHDGYSYRRKLKLDFLKIILYSLNGYPLLCQYPLLRLKFLQAQKSLFFMWKF